MDWLIDLAMMLVVQYDRTIEKTDDLKELIEISRDALNATPQGHLDGVVCLDGLGGNLERLLYKRTNDPDVLQEAITLARQAIEARPQGHAYQIACSMDLANKLSLCHELTGEEHGLREAIGIAEWLVEKH